ncbi:MAG: phage Gp37/Gp68 family protein [Candidatus Sumerlaeota bacterium]|nr:phage Gp37/Gp68 family protein [Candidatus Sumerlaeota bacterium]
MTTSRIEWTESTWNPVTGCTKISAGCRNCYAERMAKRLQAMGQPNYKNGFQLACHPHALDAPLRWKKPQVIFVNSMSDLFHENVPDGFIRQVFAVMKKADWHQFQILTKRSRRLAMMAPHLEWTKNIWIGVTVENAETTNRIHDLRKVPAVVRFISMEPLLGSIKTLDLQGIGWVIVGGESGPGAREMKKEWVLEIQQQCVAEKIPFFFKQWGGVRKKTAGRMLDGKVWESMPQLAFS